MNWPRKNAQNAKREGMLDRTFVFSAFFRGIKQKNYANHR